jgi:hypothetical protein
VLPAKLGTAEAEIQRWLAGGGLCLIGFFTLLVSRWHVVIIHAYCQLEAGLDAAGTVDAFKRVIAYLLTLGVH